jgi:enamine deaminase RidA (YjgF/YER057c/UK114 family)
MNRIIVAALVIFLGASLPLCHAQGQQSGFEKEKFNIKKESEEKVGYTQAIKTGNMLFISGSVGKGSMASAMRTAYDKISKTLKAYHLTFANIVKENIYTTEIDTLIQFQGLRKEYYGTDFPAATWVEVRRLYNPRAVIEVEVTAILPEKQ